MHGKEMRVRRIVKWISTTEAHQVEQLISQFQNIPAFLGNWLVEELEHAKHKQSCHIFVGYLASPYKKVFAEKVDRIFELLLHHASGECPRLRKKLTETTNQPEFESALFELEVGCLLLQHGYRIKAEPLYPKKGPDFRIALLGEDVYIEAKKLQHNAEEQHLWNTQHVWCRIITTSHLNNQEWNLYERYLASNQFPDDGYHILAIDTSKRLHSTELLGDAWDYYCDNQKNECSRHPIHVLILCRREKERHISWLNDLTVGASVLYNPYSPMASNVLDSLKGIFSGKQ
jgi:hypothetical protein